MSNNSRKTVLIAEDTPYLQRMIKARVAPWVKNGHDIIIVDDGTQAIDKIKELTGRKVLDALITDNNMPGFQGSEVAAFALASGMPSNRVVIISSDPEMVNGAPQGVEILMKPDTNYKDLIAKLVPAIMEVVTPTA